MGVIKQNQIVTPIKPMAIDKDEIIRKLSEQIRNYMLDNLADHVYRLADIAQSEDPDFESMEHHQSKAIEIIQKIKQGVEQG